MYDFIPDEAALAEFIGAVVPDLEDEEAFVLLLKARKKYLSAEERERVTIRDSLPFRQEVVNQKENLVRRIKEFAADGSLFTDKNGVQIPHHSFCVYLTMNPRSQRRAAVETVKKLTDLIHNRQRISLVSMVKSEIHRAPSRKIFLDLDIDPEEGDDLDAIIAKVKAILRGSTMYLIKSSTGAHILVKTAEIDPDIKKTFYQEIKVVSDAMHGAIDIKGDNMLPLPGTSQGGRVPRWIKDF
jgi:hypothetical protein